MFRRFVQIHPWLTVSVFSICLLSTTACQSQSKPVSVHGSAPVEMNPDSKPFSEIEVSVAAEMKVAVGQETSVKVLASKDAMDKLLVEIEDGELSIRAKNNQDIKETIEVTVTTPSLNSVEIAGSAEIDITGIKSDDFEIEISGSGEVEASGEVTNLTVEIAGSGEVELYELKAQNVEVEIAGSGNVEVFAGQSIDAEIAGSGHISYKGTPSKIETDVAGSGKIVRVE